MASFFRVMRIWIQQNSKIKLFCMQIFCEDKRNMKKQTFNFEIK